MKRALALTFAAAVGLTLSTPALSGKRNKKNKAEPTPAAQTEKHDDDHEHEKAEPAEGPHAAIVAYRHNLLEGVAKHFGLSKMILMGKVDRPADLAAHAKAIDAAFTDFGTLFPEGSGPDAYPQTDSLATIWTDGDGFGTAIANIQSETAKFVELAEAGDMDGAKAQFGKVGSACGGCHETYREDD